VCGYLSSAHLTEACGKRVTSWRAVVSCEESFVAKLRLSPSRLRTLPGDIRPHREACSKW
jgi:hypothetical protein